MTLTATDWKALPIDKKRDLRDRLRIMRRASMRKRFPTPAHLAYALDDSTRNPQHLAILDQRIQGVSDGDIERLMVILPPQEGKSTRTSHYGVLWMLLMDPELRIVIASYEDTTARRWGQAIRNDLIAFNLGLELQEDSKAAGRWNVKDHRGGVYCVGIGGALTGRPVDVLVIDDPVKDRAQADSVTIRENIWSWWTDVAQTRLAPGGRVILIQTRWHKEDLAGRILSSDSAHEWDVLHIAAQAEEPTEEYPWPDPLGRQPGQFLPSARHWPEGRWERIRTGVGERTWNALYQGKPSSSEGDLWKRAWWKRYEIDMWTTVGDQCFVPEGGKLIQSWDLSFKDAKTSDFVVGQVWWKMNGMTFLLDQTRARLDFPSTLQAFLAMTDKWPQATAKLVEEKANGAALISTLKRTVPGIIAINPTESKDARMAAVAPLIEAGNIWLPAQKVSEVGMVLIEEGAAFPTGSHDDTCDSASQAISYLYDINGQYRPRARIIA